jgi:hypothetical protein
MLGKVGMRVRIERVGEERSMSSLPNCDGGRLIA